VEKIEGVNKPEEELREEKHEAERSKMKR